MTGRFAPSPSGRMHLGNLWSALLAWLSARSAGGGMVLRKENISLMKENGLVVLLTAEPETVFARVSRNSGRPLLEGKMDVVHIRELLEQRRPYYEEAGELVVKTDGRSPEEISEEIKKNWIF